MAHYSSVNHKRTAETEGYPADTLSKRRIEDEGFDHFCKVSILNLYNVVDINMKKEMKGRSIEDYEKHIVVKYKLQMKNYSRYFSSAINVSPSCVVTIDSPNDLKVNDLKVNPSKSCYLYREFHPLRFMKIPIKVKKLGKASAAAKENNITVTCMENPLFSKGIEFGGVRYVFFSGEKCESRDEGYCHFTGYFFVESGWPAIDKTTVQELRESIGNFENQTDLKINTRLKLGFTTTETFLTFDSDEKISVIEDICNGGDKIMTDGCGYIAVSIAGKLFI